MPNCGNILPIMASTFEYLSISHAENGVVVLTINRPEKLNALNFKTIQELGVYFEKEVFKPEIKGIILTGAGPKSFVAGADITEFTGLDESAAKEMAQIGHKVFAAIESCPKPVIAAINGFALGGGCELAMACHFRLASSNAKFGQPEVNLGLIPGYGGTQRLPRIIGTGRAMQLLMTADLIGAEEAFRIGLVNQVFENQEVLLTEAHAIMAKILTKAPLAIAHIIESVNAFIVDESRGYNTEAELFGKACTTQDFIEGTAAFLEKRAANFTGR